MRFVNNYLHPDGKVYRSRRYWTYGGAQRKRLKAVKVLACCGKSVIAETVSVAEILEIGICRAPADPTHTVTTP